VSGLTGIAAKWNHFQNNGIRLAQEEYNSAGTPVEVIFEDSQSVGAKSISAFNKLIELDRVDGVIGADFGFAVAPLIPLANRRAKLLVTLSLPQDTYCEKSKGYFFSLASQFKLSRPTFEAYFAKHPEIKRAAMFIFDDPEWGASYQAIWSEVAAKAGVTIVDTFLSNEPNPDFRSIVVRSLAKKPDLLMLAHEPITFSKAVAASGYRGPILSANNYLEVLAGHEDVGEISRHVTIADPIVRDDFANAYRARFHEPPLLEAYSGYEAVRVVVKALLADRDHPHTALRALRYQGVAGEIDFTGPSCAGNHTRWGLFQIENGSLLRIE
jgi:ABC-type branched-subunit amino acid transport system substrate-binding protein